MNCQFSLYWSFEQRTKSSKWIRNASIVMQISIKTNEQLLTGEIDAHWNLLNLSIIIWKEVVLKRGYFLH